MVLQIYFLSTLCFHTAIYLWVNRFASMAIMFAALGVYLMVCLQKSINLGES